MVRQHGLTDRTWPKLSAIVKYLSNSHGISPEEAKPVMYMVEHRIQDEAPTNDSVKATCNNCHALGRAFSWHRTRAEWSLLADTHSALYQQAESAFRRNGRGGRRLRLQAATAGRGGRGGAAAVTSATAAPAVTVSLDASLDFLGANYGLHTPEWSAWRARMRAPKITGKWMISARRWAKANTTATSRLLRARPKTNSRPRGSKLKSVNGRPRSLRPALVLAPVYTGYSWRGRSKGPAVAGKVAPDDLAREMRETLWISPDQTWAEGRWFFGEYYEFGVDVKLRRVTLDPMLVTMDKYSLKTGTQADKVRIIGANLPAKLTPEDLDFGALVSR